MKACFPIPKVIPNRQPKKYDPIPMYYEFAKRGFEAIGFEVIPDSEQPFECPWMAIDLEWGKERNRCWWDYSDFGEISVDKRFFPCFKIELRMGDNMAFKAIPVNQIVGSQLLDNLDELRRLPTGGGTDVYFVARVTDFHGRVACARKIIEGGWESTVGLLSRPSRPQIPDDLRWYKKYPQVENYKIQRAAKICVAPPGIGEKTWRHMETLAIGGAVLIMPKTDVVWYGSIRNVAVFCERDWSDLNDKIEYLLTNENERQERARMAMDFWDDFCSPKAFAKRVVRFCGRIR